MQMFGNAKRWALAAALSTVVAASAWAAGAAGKWTWTQKRGQNEVTMNLELKQDGDKLTGTCSTDYFGAAPPTGTIDGKNVTFSIDVQGMTFTMSGTIDGDKMSGKIDPDVGTWTGTRAIVGSVVEIRPDRLEFVEKADSGALRGRYL